LLAAQPIIVDPHNIRRVMHESHNAGITRSASGFFRAGYGRHLLEVDTSSQAA
jgi:hypothetical protein